MPAAVRNAELETTQRQLGAVQRHQVVDEERHRIARELHDSVTQAVLSAGMQIEVCRSEIPDAERRDRLDLAKDLTKRAVEQLRSAIYALNHAGDSDRSTLPEMLDQLAVVHMPDELQVKVNTVGNAVELSSDLEHAVLRIAGEALFNSAVHSNASRAALRLTYRDHSVLLTVDDDGDGDPRDLRVVMRLAETNDLGGSHRGLVNMAARVREFDGTFDVRRSRLGGIRIAATIPIGA
jgi:signal transduction histidine kinase